MKDYFCFIKHELADIFIHDAKRGILLMLASIAYMLIFSWLYLFGVVKEVPLLIVDQSNTALSRQLSQAFDDSDSFKAVSYSNNWQDAEDWLRSYGRHSAALIIPEDFAENILSDRQSNVQLIIEGSNIIVTSNSSTAGMDIIRSFNAQTTQKLLERDVNQVPYLAKRRTEPVSFNYRILGNPQLDYLHFFVYGLGLVALQQGLLLSIAASVFTHRRQERFTLLPASMRWIISSGIYFTLGLVSYALCLLVGHHFFFLPLKGSLCEHIAISGAFLFCLAQVGGLIACLAKDELLFSRISIFYTVPAFMLSGYTWPLEAMPLGIQILGYISPFTYFAPTVRQLCLNGYSSSLYSNTAILFMIGLVSLPFVCKVYAKKN